MTPEGKIKRMIKKYLDTLPPNRVEVFMEVPSGFGKSQLDYTICLAGRFVAIEAKAAGKYLTARQLQTTRRIIETGGNVFVISGAEGLASFQRWAERWLETVHSADSLYLGR